MTAAATRNRLQQRDIQSWVTLYKQHPDLPVPLSDEPHKVRAYHQARYETLVAIHGGRLIDNHMDAKQSETPRWSEDELNESRQAAQDYATAHGIKTA